MRISVFTFLLFLSTYSIGQTPQVPSRMEFAGIKLKISDGARAEIQESVNSLTASEKYYNVLAERARTFFPIIERVFNEEDLPEDFKYLCLQESALISDAVSTSNAVGYWQFKDFTAVEVGMRVDKQVDERKNIVAASRGAARYMHKNNQFFDNWLHTLQAYQMGAGGAMKVLKKGMENAKTMNITKSTYWYVKKYLAHKVAFESVMNKKADLTVTEYYDGSGKTLKQIAKETGTDEEELATYNKWLKRGEIPSDKKYAVIIPGKHELTEDPIEEVIAEKPKEKPKKTIQYTFDKPGDFPKIDDRALAMAGKIVEINGLPGIVAGVNDRIPDLANKAEMSLSKFLKYNDLGIDGRLVPGQVYYIKSKRSKAKAYYHVTQYNETLWSVSQKFGIKLKKLKLKNRIKGDEKIKPGRVLWLRYVRPANVEIEYRDVPVPYVKPPEKQMTVIKDVEPELDTAIQIESKPVMEEDVLVDSVVIQPIVKPDSSEVEKTMESETEPAMVTENVKLEDEIEKVELETVEIDSAALEPIEEIALLTKTHEVKMGETYYSISKMYDVSVLDLIAWNELDINDKLSIGQKLLVKVKKGKTVQDNKEQSAKSADVYHEIKQGETLYSISRKYGVSVQDIMKWNNMEDQDLKFGQKLRIEQPVK